MKNKMEQSIISLAEDMQFKLIKNAQKHCDKMNPNSGVRNWSHLDHEWLLGRAKQEIIELEESIACGDIKNAILECADVANFVMMVHDNLRHIAGSDFSNEK